MCKQSTSSHEALREATGKLTPKLAHKTPYDDLVPLLVERAKKLRASSHAYASARDNPEGITVPGIEGMTTREKMELYLAGDLTDTQLGALAAHLAPSVQLHGSIAQGRVFTEKARAQGAEEVRTSLQGYNLRMGSPNNKGECLPLVRALAVAEVLGGGRKERLLDRFLETSVLCEEMRSSGKPPTQEQLDAAAFLNALAAFHSSGLGSAHSVFDKAMGTLGDLRDALTTEKATTYFEMNTSNHSMMAGVVVDGGRKYVFYDPNMGRASFSDAHALVAFLKDHFTEELCDAYNLSDPLSFGFYRVDANAMRSVPVADGKTVEDLSGPNWP